MITKVCEAKTLIKYISCDCKFTFNSAPCNSNQEWNNDKCQCERKSLSKEIIVEILLHVFVRVASI